MTVFCPNIQADLVYSHTGYYVISYLSAFVEQEITTENGASDDYVSNFSGAAFCLPHQPVGFLLGKTSNGVLPYVMDRVRHRSSTTK